MLGLSLKPSIFLSLAAEAEMYVQPCYDDCLLVLTRRCRERVQRTSVHVVVKELKQEKQSRLPSKQPVVENVNTLSLIGKISLRIRDLGHREKQERMK